MLTVVPFGSHIVAARAEGAEAEKLGEIFWLSQLASLEGPGAIRGGVPLIAPQFADLMDGPKHGWARTANWQLTPVDHGTLSIADYDDLLLEFFGVTTRTGVEVSLRAVNTGLAPRRVQVGLHPYFAVGDVEKLHVVGLEGADLYDRASNRHYTGANRTTFNGEFDRICRGTAETVSIIDPVLGRRIDVTGQDNDAFVVWNPGRALAANIADIQPGGWRHFLCVEPARLGKDLDGVELGPGESAQVVMQVALSSL